MDEATKKAFPKAWMEMAEAGRSYAVGLYTAAVFHSMRGAEIGLRAVARELKVEFSYSIELAEQESIIREVEKKAKGLINDPKNDQRDKDQKFFSDIIIQFRAFKDAWRNRVSHGRESYDEAQALDVLEHVAKFFGVLATRLREADI
jgi:hypothetical protein